MVEAPSDWIGRQRTQTDHADASAIEALSDLLDHETPPWTSQMFPPLGHWLRFLPAARQSRLGHDGHPQRGDDLPPIDLPRRMWVASEVTFLAPVATGAALTRTTTIEGLDLKEGRSGKLAFLTQRHLVNANDVPVIDEVQTIVYRDAEGATAAPMEQPVPAAAWQRWITADTTLLFRFSALTYNAHRIHYDRDYATGVEGYPGLVVHGPLIATLLMDLYLRHAKAPPRRFAFRARAPLFDGAEITLNGTPTDSGAGLEAYGPDGNLAMSAEVWT